LKVGVVKLKKNEKKTHFTIQKKTYFLYCSVLAGPLALHFQDDL
jgi:hypothetical protein